MEEQVVLNGENNHMELRGEELFRLLRLRLNRTSIDRNLSGLARRSIITIRESVQTIRALLGNDPCCNLTQGQMSDLREHFSQQDALHEPGVSEILVSESSTCFSLNMKMMYTLNREQVRRLLNRVATMCQHSLQTLNLAGHNNLIRKSSVHHLLIRQNNLQSIYFIDVGIDHTSMAVIGRYCHKLKQLSIHCERKVNDEGLHYLWSSEEPYGKCRGLKRLDFSVTNTTLQILVPILNNLKELEYLQTDHNVMDIVEILANADQPQPLALKNVEEIHERHCNNVDAAFIFTFMLKNLQILQLNLPNGELTHIENFLKFNKILELNIKEGVSNDQFFMLCQTYSASLTVVKIENSNVVDVSILGYVCHNLVRLECKSIAKIECKYELDTTHFTQLQHFELASPRQVARLFPNSVLMIMFCAPTLEKVLVYDYIVSDEVIESLVQRSQHPQNQGHLMAKLAYLTVKRCGLSLRNLQRLVCLTPTLRRISLGENSAHAIALQDFARENGLRFEVSN